MSRNISGKVKEFVFRRDQGKCVYCGSTENLEFDHVIPITKGGSNSERNIQLTCFECNRAKFNYLDDDFLKITRNQREKKKGSNISLLLNDILIPIGIINKLDWELSKYLMGLVCYHEDNHGYFIFKDKNKLGHFEMFNFDEINRKLRIPLSVFKGMQWERDSPFNYKRVLNESNQNGLFIWK